MYIPTEELIKSLSDEYGYFSKERITNKKSSNIKVGTIKEQPFFNGKVSEYIYVKIEAKTVRDTKFNRFKLIAKMGGTSNIVRRLNDYSKNGNARQEGKDFCISTVVQVSEKVYKKYPIRSQEGHFDENLIKELIKNSWFNETFKPVFGEGESFESKNGLSKKEVFDIVEKLNNLVESLATEDAEIANRYLIRQTRKNQTTSIKEILNVFKTQEDCLLYSAPRSGKSLISIVVGLLNGSNTIFCLSPMTKASNSFREVIENVRSIYIKEKNLTLDLSGWRFFDSENLKDWDGNCDKCMFFISFQLARFSRTDDNGYEEISLKYKNFCDKLYLSKKPIKGFLIVDEAHHTSDSKESEDAIIFFKNYCKKTLYMSGTPFNDIYSRRFPESQIVSYDLIQALKDGYIKFPKLNIFYEKILQSAVDKALKVEADIDEGRTKVKGRVLNVLQQALATPSRINVFFSTMFMDSTPYHDDFWFNSEDDHKKIFIYVPNDFSYINKRGEEKRTNIAEQVKKVIEELSVGKYRNYFVLKDYVVEIADDKHYASEEEVNEFFSNNEKAILICKERHTTGETFPLLDTILLFRNVSSSEWFWQTACRVMSYPKEGEKKNVYIYIFDNEVSLSVVASLIFSHTKKKDNLDSEKESLKDLKALKDCLYISIEDMDFYNLPEMEILSKIKDITSKRVMSLGAGLDNEIRKFFGSLDTKDMDMLKHFLQENKISSKILLIDNSSSKLSLDGDSSINTKSLLKEKPIKPSKEKNVESMMDKACIILKDILDRLPVEILKEFLKNEKVGTEDILSGLTSYKFYSDDFKRNTKEYSFKLFCKFIESNRSYISKRVEELKCYYYSNINEEKFFLLEKGKF